MNVNEVAPVHILISSFVTIFPIPEAIATNNVALEVFWSIFSAVGAMISICSIKAYFDNSSTDTTTYFDNVDKHFKHTFGSFPRRFMFGIFMGFAIQLCRKVSRDFVGQDIMMRVNYT